ncbi:hypothetical protein [Niabella aquatica]
MKKNIFYLLFVAFFLPACYRNSLEALSDRDECNTANITYSKDIRTIISTRCAISSCHQNGSMETFSLETFEDLKNIVANGELLKSINHEAGVAAMPKNVSKLPLCTISKITAWVNAGAPDN